MAGVGHEPAPGAQGSDALQAVAPGTDDVSGVSLRWLHVATSLPTAPQEELKPSGQGLFFCKKLH